MVSGWRGQRKHGNPHNFILPRKCHSEDMGEISMWIEADKLLEHCCGGSSGRKGAMEE